MNSFQRFTKRLHGEAVDRPPNFNIMMTFAAHHINQPLSRYYMDYRVLCEANLAVQQDFKLDIVQAISDPYRETADFGAEIEFPPDSLPLCKKPLLVDLADLEKLTRPEPTAGRRMSDRLEAIRMFREQVGGEVPIMGWVEGALAEAADLRGVSELMLDLALDPEQVEALLEICADVAVAFARAQIEAGADIIGLGDAIASQISAEMYERFALPYEQRIFKAVHALGGIARLHICGNTTHLLPLMPRSGADIIDLDWMVDMQAAGDQLGDQVSLCGNFDPVAVMLQGSPDEVYRATMVCMQAGGKRSISGAGCEIPDKTPVENLQAQVQALRDFGAS